MMVVQGAEGGSSVANIWVFKPKASPTIFKMRCRVIFNEKPFTLSNEKLFTSHELIYKVACTCYPK